MQSIRFHLTNITSLGATTLLKSLMPALEKASDGFIKIVDIPESGPLSKYSSISANVVIKPYGRYLPNALSRALECTLFAYRFNGVAHIIVLGDLPLRVKCNQTLFVQQSHLIPPKSIFNSIKWFRYLISRLIFRLNSKYVDAFVVQTEAMRTALGDAYPSIAGRIHVVSQPVPEWLLSSGLKRSGRVFSDPIGLNLIYPAAGYLHKNHKLLSKIDSNSIWPIEKLQITLEDGSSPAPNLPWLCCRGFLSPQEVIHAYSQVDALLFLSKEESYGFPLVEAMYVGLPIVCPDLPYARVLCGDEAIYFDPDSVDSLKAAVGLLKSRLEEGWWPNWDEQMKCIPKDWNAVAHRMLQIAAGQNLED
jgi:glycosyltransferase involved in cell wall biosynthesis